MTGPDGARGRRRFDVSGVVQGVGFRPFVYAAAAELQLTGMVHNDVAGVVIEVEGATEHLTEFGRRLEHAHPPLAVVESFNDITALRVAAAERGVQAADQQTDAWQLVLNVTKAEFQQQTGTR